MGKKTCLNKESGFTLIEILMVIIVAGAIAALALPRYNKMMEQRYAYNAKLNLLAIHSAVQIYLLKQWAPCVGKQWASCTPVPTLAAAGDTPAVNTTLGLNIMDSNFTYTLIDANVPASLADPSHYQARAYRGGFANPASGSQYFLGVILDQPIGSSNPLCTNGTKTCPIGSTPWDY